MLKVIPLFSKSGSMKYFEIEVVYQRDALDQNSKFVTRKQIPTNFITYRMVFRFSFCHNLLVRVTDNHHLVGGIMVNN